MKRNKCILCQSDVTEFHRIKNMPGFMGVVDINQNIIREDMIFGECVSCGLLQNVNLLNTEIVYLNNHNTNVVGEIWHNHYVELSEFIKKNSKGDIILEIGDPSAKLANLLHKLYKRWIIIEPNTELKNHQNIEIIKGFFDGNNPTPYKINTIVHSHVFEHIYEPVNFLKDCANILEKDGLIIFSIPNIKWLLENNSLPTSILHFEHTYYVNENNIEIFLNRSGFKLLEILNYNNHSLFIKAIKCENLDKSKSYRFNDKKKFMNLVNYFESKIVEINKRIGNSEYYLYSAHINSQYLLNNGITKNIKSILDRSDSKIGKKLYGYNFDVCLPDIIKNDENPIVVASHMSVYYHEITKSLLEINPNTVIL